MIKGRNKRVVILKDIPSNIIEEAILVLRTNGKGENDNKAVIIQGKKGSGDAHILSEARMIINNFIKDNQVELGNMGLLNLKPYNSKKKTINYLINGALFGSIILLVLLMYKMF